MLCMLVNKCLSSNKRELILIKFNCSNNYYYLNKVATYIYTTLFRNKNRDIGCASKRYG